MGLFSYCQRAREVKHELLGDDLHEPSVRSEFHFLKVLRYVHIAAYAQQLLPQSLTRRETGALFFFWSSTFTFWLL